MLVSETARVVPGLVLVETGLGDIERPEQSLGRTFLDRTAAILEPGETPVHQIARLGYSPKDVRHIVLTHVDLDHTGRAPRLSRRQGPRPRRRVPAAMATTSTHPKHAIRYRPAHWAHHPHWVTYTTASRGAWFGFDAIELACLPTSCWCPRPGTPPATARWRCTPATGGCCTPGTPTTTTARSTRPGLVAPPIGGARGAHRGRPPLRMANLARLLELRRDHAGTVEIFSAHALGRPAVPVQLWEPG